MRRAVTLLGMSVVLSTGFGSTAWATGGPIGPNQHFIGLVTNHHVKAVVTVVCPGPVWPGRTGHVFGGQSFAVHQVASGGGFTGPSGGGIFVRLSTNPPGQGVLFTTYDTQKAIPTSWTAPCSGSGQAIFTPVPIVSGNPNGRPDVVPVTFENIAV